MSALPYEVFDPEQLTVNTVDFVGPAFLVLDLSNLWIPQTTWENRVAPGQPGSQPLPGIEDELRTSLPFILIGAVSIYNVPQEDPRRGLRRNWNILNNKLFVPDGSTTYYSATYTPPDPLEAPITFRIQILAPTITERYPDAWRGTMPVILPDGALWTDPDDLIVDGP